MRISSPMALGVESSTVKERNDHDSLLHIIFLISHASLSYNPTELISDVKREMLRIYWTAMILIYFFCRRLGCLQKENVCCLIMSIVIKCLMLSHLWIQDLICVGWPHGGIAIIWKKSISVAISHVKFNNKRFCGILLTFDNGFTLL